jgi:hypothetical protein
MFGVLVDYDLVVAWIWMRHLFERSSEIKTSIVLLFDCNSVAKEREDVTVGISEMRMIHRCRCLKLKVQINSH